MAVTLPFLMHTLLTDSPAEAAALLNGGKIVAFPTETVYGLGATINHSEALKQIFVAKGRPSDNPLILHIAHPDNIGKVAATVPRYAERFIEKFFPGPLTLVLPKQPQVPELVTAGLQSVGVRCPAHPMAQALLALVNSPVAAPSANRSGKPSATSWETVYDDLNGRIDGLLRSAPCTIGLESTIVDCTANTPLLLRAGAITLEQLQAVVPSLRVNQPTHNNEPPKSPGLKYPHYAPHATIELLAVGAVPLTLPPNSAYIGIAPPPNGATLVMQCASIEAYGNALFQFFRTCDAHAIRTIYCELPTSDGLGRAIGDRLLRAAGRM
uniref:Threonylcarbamoyl-AMP synthase n=1 Tax=Chlorobium chlorochromatii (strain CaD3) TaxID=340177 RepID=Q3AQA5_CHLCH